MLSQDENALLTRIGPGSQMGMLLRRYWHPIGGVSEIAGRWTKRVRLLGEDLVLFRDRTGTLSLIAEFCPHRRASLAYGIPTQNGIRCPYHGWEFDGSGRCLDQPNEPPESTFKDKVRTAAYPVEELGGMLFAYLGPEPRPLLPRFDGFVVEPAIRMIGRAVVPCNWLQIMENSLDPVHTEWLHGNLQEFIEEQRGAKYSISRKHLKIAFEEFEYGIYKRRLLLGQTEDADDWRVGHPVIFPTTLAVGSGDEHWRMFAFQIRVPMDDTHTMHYWYTAYAPPPDVTFQSHLLERVPVYDVPFTDASGEYLLDLIDAQDIMAWVTQGPIADRTAERLGSSDRGVTLFRRMLLRELKAMEEGRDPLGVLRDSTSNGVIDIPLEKGKAHFSDGFASLLSRTQARYSPFADDLVRIFERGARPSRRPLHPLPAP